MVLETTILPLNYSCITQTGIAGFEPTIKDSKSFVLPLDYIPLIKQLHRQLRYNPRSPLSPLLATEFFIDPLQRICTLTLNLLVPNLLDLALNLLDVSESQYYLMTSIVTSSR